MKRMAAYFLTAVFAFLLGVVLSPVHFTAIAIGCGPRGSSRYYTSTYFRTVLSTESYYNSPEEATAAWEGILRRADSVVEHTSVPGSRAVIVESHGNGEREYAVIWVDGKTLRGAYSTSLWLALAFEQQRKISAP